MPSTQSKRLFVGGLDRDTDLRALKNGDYHYALNIRNVSSEASTEGVVENIKGNKKVAYDFPTPPLQGKRRITLFMPWFNYWFNYGGSSASFDQSVVLENFDGHLRDENDPNTYTIATSAVDEDGYPLGYNIFEEVTNYPFPNYYAGQYGPGDNPGEDGAPSQTYIDLGGPSIVLRTFDICIALSQSEISNPPYSQRFQISYNGETATEMYNYLTHWVQANSTSLATLGITVSVIDNNNGNFNNAYFFGESTMQNITSHPDYTPGQVWAYALLFEAVYSEDANGNIEGEYYVDLRPSASTQPESAGQSDDVTGTLFTPNANGESPYFWAVENTAVEDGYGFANEAELLNNSIDWSVVADSLQSGELQLTEYLNGIESVGWTIGDPLEGDPRTVVKTFLRANATISNDITDEGDPINYDTIGAYEDTRNDKIYWFVASDHSFHLILEYDIKENDIKTVFRDSGDVNTSVFNWRKEFLINDIDRVGDVLYWTSRQYGEPCSINIRKSVNSIARIDLNLSLGNDALYVLNEEGGTDDISLEDYYPYSLYDPLYPSESKRQYVEVIKRPPLYAPTYAFGSSPSIAKNEIFGNLFQFRYRYVFYDDEVSAWSPISDIVRSAFDNNNVSQTNITPGVDNLLIVSVKNSSGIVKKIEVAGRKCKDLGIIGRGNRGPYSIVATLDNDFSAWQLDFNSEQTFRFFNDQAFPITQAGEGERLYDAVPRSAHTQTILGNNRLAYGNYTEGFDVPKVAFTVSPQYGHTQNGNIYGGPTYQDPVTLQTGGAVPSFKSGAFHSFGIVYYDEKGRCSTVLVDPDQKGSNSSDGRCYVKFPTERVSGDVPTGVTADLTGAVTMKWEINHQAPGWAKHYRFFYSRNNTVDEFVQFRVLQAKGNNDGASNDNRIFLNLRGLKGSDDSYITNAQLNPDAVPNPDISILDYEFTKGDRVRIMTQGSQTGATFGAENMLTTYLDARVSGFEFYDQGNPNIPIRNNDGTNALLADGSEDGWYLIIEELINSSGTPIAGYSSASVLANSDSLEQAIVEIYKPKADPEPGEMLYFEFSELYDIDGFRKHLGPVSDQGVPWVYDSFGNAISTTPAVGEFKFGDVYYKNRNMQRFSGGVRGSASFYVEDYFLNDYTDSNHINIGRANIYSTFYKQQDKEASVTYSDVYQPATSFNGLSTFDYNLGNWEDYSRIYGTIQKLFYRETDIVMIQEDATYKIPVQRDILLSADGQGTVGVSNKVLNPVVPFAGNYGISKNPESFVANGMVLYWTDIRRGAILRLSGDGITPISDAKMHDYFRDREEDFRIYDPQYRWSSNYGEIKSYMLGSGHEYFRIKGGFNPKHEEYIVQMDSIYIIRDGWDYVPETWNVTGDWDGSGELPESEEDVLVGGSVTAWRDKQKRWTSFYSHMGEYYCKINRQFVSWNEGFLYLHDLDEENYNTFYGVTYFTRLDFPINDGPSTVKGFKSITLEANQAPEADSEGYEFEGVLNTSYDVTLITDMTETLVDRHNFDQRENKQYAQIPFVTVNSTGSEIIGLGIGSASSSNATVSGDGTGFGNANLITGTSSDPGLANYGDQLYFNNSSGVDVFVGTISNVGSNTQLTLANNSTSSFDDNFLFVKRNGYAEGDRMKGRYMEVKMKKRSKKLLEIFSGSATIFNSELSDD